MLRQNARELGFDGCGVCDASPPSLTRFRDWLSRGYAGQMDYLGDRLDAYQDPNMVLQGVRSIVMLTLPYRTEEPRPPGAGEGRISRYAWGEADYHDTIHRRLKTLLARLVDAAPQLVGRGVVDTAPILEREMAVRAGLGWVGKNTLLLRPEEGSWFFLAALLLDVTLTYDSPFTTDHCGTCTACLDACPTDAFPQPYVLDATRCISYLTIEHRESIATELREGIGDWLFGCDVCQDVCPWNSKSSVVDTAEFQPSEQHNPANAVEWFELDESQWRARFRNTPLWRAKRRGLLRNAAIVLGNQPPGLATDVLCRHLDDEDPVIRGAIAWALRHDQSDQARTSLQRRL
ncbi:MAG: tRNA epoxyqueuosine(34) reductase QueG, partial [Pirellulaceae bacterium]